MNIDKNSLRAKQWRRKRDRPATIFSQWYGGDSQLPNAQPAAGQRTCGTYPCTVTASPRQRWKRIALARNTSGSEEGLRSE